ncbi:MAG: hypothetical protein LUC90_11045 [Lachnospiraceae bacterium]|nr:hypothetical protein [Lachnospiraceae bacterium]
MEKGNDVSGGEKVCRYMPEAGAFGIREISPGMSIVMSRWIGLQGTARIVCEHESEVAVRLPVRMIRQMMTYAEDLSLAAQTKIAERFNVCEMLEIKDGGIWRALWELAQDRGVGLTVQLWKIPVRQETVEVCEIFGLNPYELLSGGALLMVTNQGEALAEALEEAGIHGTVIGRITDSNDRIVLHHTSQGLKKRYLNRPGIDEIDKL